MLRLILVALVPLALGGCIKSMAVNALGDALAQGGGTYARDDDPDLVAAATPFGLKTIESLLDAEPEHRGLLLAAARGFTQYGYAFTQVEADYVEDADFDEAQHLRRRAKRLYARARAYGVRGLEVEHEDLIERLRSDRKDALSDLEDEDVPLLYWTATAWAAGVALDKDDVELAADLDLVEAMIDRAFALEPTYGAGALHDFYVAWYGGRPKAAGGSDDKARHHMEQSLEVSKGQRVAPLVSFAEIVSVKRQNKAEFTELLQRALAFDADSAPPHRLANLVAQKRARWLLAQVDDLFLE
ncbi:MAG: hypothetical protein H6704_02715 [Myxococcales bacterium]|nr:TRAP transporter TatT component family protein [Myxococcales bacterium]MCB9535149.1 hypothetical protein [Myxococcales bacterium]